MLLVSDGASITRGVSTLLPKTFFWEQFVNTNQNIPNFKWKKLCSCKPSVRSQNLRNKFGYPCIQLVPSLIFSMHVKNLTDKMSDCIEFPWKICAHSQTCLCSNTSILHKNISVISENIRIFCLRRLIVRSFRCWNNLQRLMYLYYVHHIWNWREIPTWYNNLFIVINNSTCFGHLYAHLQEY